MVNDNFTYIPGANEPNARANHVWDSATNTWVRDEKYKINSPMVDVDTTYIWNLDGTPNQIIEIFRGQTKTTVFTWNPDGSLASESVVIT